MSEPKFCKDCKHYFPEGGGHSKLLPGCDQQQVFDLVTGRQILASAYDMRDVHGQCKPEALLWEKKPPFITGIPAGGLRTLIAIDQYGHRSYLEHAKNASNAHAWWEVWR